MFLFFLPLCLSQYLVQANPVPCGGHEVLLDGVGKKCILVGAPYAHRRYVYQWCVKTLLQLQGKKTGGKRGFNNVEKTLDLVAEGKKQTYMC